MSKIGLIIGREYSSRVKKKSFIVMTILVPILSAVFLIGAVYLGTPEVKDLKVLVVDDTGIIVDDIIDNQKNNKIIPKTAHGNIVDDPDAHLNEKYTFQEYEEVANGKSADDAKIDFVENEKYKDCDVILYIPKNITYSKVVKLYYKETPSPKALTYINLLVNESIEIASLSNYNITKEDYQEIKKKITLHSILYSDKDEKDTRTAIKAGIGFAFGLMIYMFIFLYGVQVMKGVIEEKTNRIVEVIISSVKPFELMMGKIIGIMFVGLTQFFMWVVLIGVLTTVVVPFVVPDEYSPMFQAGTQTEIQTSQEVGAMIEPELQNTMQGNELLDVLINETPWASMLLVFLFFFIGGYLLYGSLMAAIGSAVDSETDTQQFMLPVTMPLVFAYLISIMGIQDPDSPIMVWCSQIPFTSPVVMLVRYSANGGVGMGWDLVLSMFLLVITFIATTWLAAKIYRTGILMYGKKVTYKELFKWLKY